MGPSKRSVGAFSPLPHADRQGGVKANQVIVQSGLEVEVSAVAILKPAQAESSELGEDVSLFLYVELKGAQKRKPGLSPSRGVSRKHITD